MRGVILAMSIFDRLVIRTSKARPTRLSIRVATELRVNVRLARDGVVHSVLLSDLSTGGARITTPLRLSKNDVLTLMFEPSHGAKIEIVSRIVSVRPRQGELHLDYGLNFVALKRNDGDAIRRFVLRHQQLQMGGATAFSAARAR